MSKLLRYVATLGFMALAMLLYAPVVITISQYDLPALARLHIFMQTMACKDFESAYSLYAPQAKESMSLSNLQEMTDGSDSVLFEGYRGFIPRDFDLLVPYSVPGSSRPPEYTHKAKIEGTMLYQGKNRRTFNAVLVRVDDLWVIESIQIDSSSIQP